MNNIEARKTLLRRQTELAHRLSAVEADLQKTHSKDWDEQAQERENDEVLEAIASQTANELLQIKRVLHKLGDHSSYGVCKRCGQAIGKQRLSVIPETEFCVGCANDTH